jgi:hypothetical protein
MRDTGAQSEVAVRKGEFASSAVTEAGCSRSGTRNDAGSKAQIWVSSRHEVKEKNRIGNYGRN